MNQSCPIPLVAAPKSFVEKRKTVAVAFGWALNDVEILETNWMRERFGRKHH